MNSAHLHLILNHVPVLGTAFGLLLLLAGLLRRNEALQRAALITFVVVALAAIPTYLTGEPAEEIVEHLAGTAEPAIEAHETAALISLVAIEVLGAFALLSLLFAARAWARPMARLAFGVALVTVGLMAWTANLGGRIRHSELAGGSQTQQNQEREGDHERPGEGR